MWSCFQSSYLFHFRRWTEAAQCSVVYLPISGKSSPPCPEGATIGTGTGIAMGVEEAAAITMALRTPTRCSHSFHATFEKTLGVSSPLEEKQVLYVFRCSSDRCGPATRSANISSLLSSRVIPPRFRDPSWSTRLRHDAG